MNGSANERRHVLTWLLIALTGVALVKRALDFREDRAARAELALVNHTEVPVLVQYRGYYESAQAMLPPGGSWSTPFRDLDVLVMQATYAGLALSNRALLMTGPASSEPPRRVNQALYVVHEVWTHDGERLLQAVVISPSPGRDLIQDELKQGLGRTNLVCW